MSREITDARTSNAEVTKQIKEASVSIQSLAQDKDQLEKSISQLDSSLREVDSWLQKHHHLNNDSAMNIDTLTDPKDSLSRQLSGTKNDHVVISDV